LTTNFYPPKSYRARKFTSKFKTKVVLEVLKEQSSLKELAQKYKLHPQQIRTWKSDFISGAESIFETKKKSPKTEAEQREDSLLTTIGKLTVENDFLKKNLK